MKKIFVALILLLVFCIPGLAQYTKFTPLLTPAKGSNLVPISINNANQILATYTNATGQRKLIFAGTKGFTNVNIPLDTSTVSLSPLGLNNVGDFFGAASRLIGLNRIDAAFTKCHTTGPLRYFKIPGALGTVITGINDKGVMVGYYWEPNTDPDTPDWAPNVVNGFKSVLPNSGIFPPIESFEGSWATSVYLTGINNNGDIIGYQHYKYEPNSDEDIIFERGYLFSKGQWHELQLDLGEGNRWILIPLGINNHGVIVGRAHPIDGHGMPSRGFIWENGVVSLVDYPSTSDENDLPIVQTLYTSLVGVNDSGVILGAESSQLFWSQDTVKGGFILTK
jgi:hypothetical protein